MTGYQQYKKLIDSCVECAALCTNCASSCLKEENVAEMATCIQLSLECSAICKATAELMSLGSERVKHIARICESLCDACAEECNKYLSEHCLECAAACNYCADQLEIVV